MRDRGAIERVLKELRGDIDFPRGVDMSAAVGRRIEQEPAPSRGPSLSPRALRIATVVAAVVILATGIVLATPAAREAVADWLGISGVRIEQQEAAPSPDTSPTPIAPDLGPRVSLGSAVDEAGFPVLVPGDLGTPGAVHLDTGVAGTMVHLTYEPRPGLPAGDTTELGLLVTEFRAGVDQDMVKKVITSETTLEPVRLGDVGYWIEGAPHTIFYLDELGNVIDDETRLAGNVLLWEEDGVSYRFEGELGKGRALQIARSMTEPE
jgi:hypothetical protein